MPTFDELVAAVDAAFVETSRGLAPWSCPRPRGDMPAEEEYSRVTDPERYHLLTARAEAWMRAVTELGLASVRPVLDVDWAMHPRLPPPTSIRRLEPAVPGAVPVHLLVSGFGGLDDNGLGIGVGDPAVALDPIPDCGCDACDSGSADLLEVLDEALGDVVTGAFMHRRRGERYIILGRRTGQASGDVLSRRARRRSRGDPRPDAWRYEMLDATEGWDEVSGSAWL